MNSLIEKFYDTHRDEEDLTPDEGAVADAAQELKDSLKAAGLTLGEQDEIFSCAAVYAIEYEKKGFEAGFKMARRILQALQEDEETPAKEKAVNVKPKQEKRKPAAVPLCDRVAVYAASVAYARISKDTRWGARLCFNSTSAAYLGDARRCDVYVEDGNILVYPDENGHYAITKIGNTEQRTIACGAIIKNLVRDGCRCAVIPAENHVIVRVA